MRRAAAVCAASAFLLAFAGPAPADCAPGTVDLRGATGTGHFAVEVASTEAEREYGLMNRSALPPDTGMLFVFPGPVQARFWMKDTLIPLDIVFADPAGRVTRVARNARPLDETVIDGGPGVLYVLEVNAGVAGTLGLGPGSLMRGAGLDPARAAWPCSAP